MNLQDLLSKCAVSWTIEEKLTSSLDTFSFSGPIVRRQEMVDLPPSSAPAVNARSLRILHRSKAEGNSPPR